MTLRLRVVAVRRPARRAGRARDRLPRYPEGKTVKNRLHVDLTPVDATQSEEVERLLDLGAVPADVGQGPDATWVVLADPEGNEFCVLRGRAESD